MAARAAPASTSSLVAADAGLLLLEHLNLNVLSTQVALDFYEALGCVRDARRPMEKTLHCNCGTLTQFHTPSPENEAYIGSEGAQRWRGEIEILYENTEAVAAAAERVRVLLAKEAFGGSELAVAAGGGEGEVKVTCPYGNEFALRAAGPQQRFALGSASGVRPGSEESKCVGLGSVVLIVPPGTAARGARFYAEVLGFGIRELADGRWAILGGPCEAQALVLAETQGATGEELGEHVAIYIGDYAGCFERLLSRGLIFVNPRFEHLDKSTTLEEAYHYNCFRFKDVIDIDSGEKLFELEHEVRSTGHKSCALGLNPVPFSRHQSRRW